MEGQIDKLKYERAAMSPSVYRKELTAVFLELARVQQELDQ